MTILDDALAWHGAGCYVLPVRPDGTKAPGVHAWHANAEPHTAPMVTSLFAGGVTDGVGVVCGSPSVHLEMLEVEGRAIETVDRLARLCEDNGLGDVWVRLAEGYVEATPSGGIHWLFRTPGPAAPNTKLARRPGANGPDVTWETRGQGGFVVVAPSAGRTHATGRAWTTIVGSPSTIPELSVDERDALYAVVRMLDEMPALAPIAPRAVPAGDSGERPGDDYEARTGWGEILDGWTVVRRFSGGGLGWRRPGKDTPGLSATTGMRADADRLYVFSSSTEFESERPYSKFGAYALLHHGGDHAAAARELRRQGYGAARPQPDDDWSWAGNVTTAESRPFPPAAEPSAAPARDESQVAVTEGDYGNRIIRGGSFLFDRPRRPVPVWGERADVLWSQGEPCIITGPIGAGKTTLLGRLVHASLSLSRRVLDFPVSETERVLYFASDRPAQIARNLARMFDEDDRDELDERLVVWQGPPPVDVAKNPAILLEIAQHVGATRVFIDGLKDVAAKISEEETGQGLNRAMQLLVVEGIDVVANHHQRKAAGAGLTKPKSLDDVYGSNWISAGAGTVVLLWVSEAGAQDVELSTIKPAADNVGPLPLLHETDLGTLELKPEVDDGESPRTPNPKSVGDVLRAQRHSTMTAKEIGKALRWPEKEIDRKTRQIRRACEVLGEEGLVQDHPMSKARGGSPESHYQWTGE